MAASNLNLGKASGGVLNVQPADGTTTTSLVLPAINGTVVAADSNGNVGIGTVPSAWGSGGWLEIASTAGLTAKGGLNIGSNWYYNNGYKYTTTAAASNYFQQDGQHIWYTAPSGTAGNSVPLKYVMSLDNNGILTLSPNNTSGIQDGLILYDAGSGVSEGIKIKWSSLNYSNIASIYGSGNYGLYFQIGGLDKMLLDTNGNFDVLGSINCGYNGTSYGASGSSSLVAYGGDGSCYTQVIGRNTSGSSAVFYSVVAGVNKSAILSNGNFQSATNSYGSTSDIKLKENVQDASPKLDKLMQVQVRTFNYIGQEDKQIGVVAQEIEQIFPSIVYETKDTKQVEVEKEREVTLEDGTLDIEKYTEMETVETGEVTKNVKYSVIYMMMLKAMQEQNEIIKDLKSRIEILEAK